MWPRESTAPTRARPTPEEMKEAFEALHEALREAYWKASTIEVKDRIRGLEEIVFEIQTALNRAELSARTAAYRALKEKLLRANDSLEQLKGEIDGIVSAVDTAKGVASALDRAVNLARGFIA
jgi:hypothetical protein